jgi:predicted lipoprotein with Yx(FWY)xxD motif
MRRAGGALAVLIAGTVLAGCSSSASTGKGDALLVQRVPAHVTVTTTRLPKLGAVLTDSAGHPLYMFPPDAGSRVSCVGACAGTWPPLAIADAAKPTASGQVNPLDLATLTDPNTGAKVITYFGYPLYRYAGDVRPGTANGQALFSDGGPWYVLSADGQPVTVDPSVQR